MNPPIVVEKKQITHVIDVGHKLKMLRNKAGYSANRVTEKLKENYALEISVNSINSYENNRRTPNIMIFFALCDLYECNDISEFFGVSNSNRERTQITLDDYSYKDIVDILYNHYGKSDCIKIINKMICKIAE